MICATCTNWNLKDTPRDIARFGYAKCALKESWRYLAPHNTCERHSPAPKEVADKRRKWLKEIE